MSEDTLAASDTGITTYIKSTLMCGTSFSRKNGGGVRASAQRGLWVGRTADTLFGRHITGRVQLVPSCPAHQRVCHVVRALRCHGVRLLFSQFPVQWKELCLHTRVDAVGMRGDEVVVVELKTTQHSRQKHASLYESTCSRKPVLSNGLANSEYVQHMLQTAFAALCLKRVLPAHVRVSGMVVVSFATSAAVVPVPKKFATPSWFMQPQVHRAAAAGPCRRRRRRRTVADPWPDGDARARQALASVGLVVGRVVAGGRLAVLEGGDAPSVAACCHTDWSQCTAAARKHVRAFLLKTSRDVFKDVANTRTFVLSPSRTLWRLTQIRQ